MSVQTFLIINSVSNILCFVAGYYISHRGLTGVKSDLQDIGSDVKHLQEKVRAKKAAA